MKESQTGETGQAADAVPIGGNGLENRQMDKTATTDDPAPKNDGIQQEGDSPENGRWDPRGYPTELLELVEESPPDENREAVVLRSIADQECKVAGLTGK